VIPGVGGGFFNDRNPTIFDVGSKPGPILFGTFDGRPDLVSVNSGSNDLTLISDVGTPGVTIRSIPSGGVDPVTAFAFGSGGGFDNLVVGNNGDGVLALLVGDPGGLDLVSTITDRAVPSPTALVFSALTGSQVDFFAATAGREEAIPLAFDLGSVTIPGPAPAALTTVAQLVPLRESSLSLVGALLVLTVPTPAGETEPAAGESVATTAAGLVTGPAPSAGQSFSAQSGSATDQHEDPDAPADFGDGTSEPEDGSGYPVPRERSIWKRYFLGIDDAQGPQRPEARVGPPPATRDGPSALVIPRPSGGPGLEAGMDSARPDITEAVDQALYTLMHADTVWDRPAHLAPGAASQHTSEASGPADSADFVPFVPDPVHPECSLLPAVSDPAGEDRMNVSLSVIAATLVLSRVFASIHARGILESGSVWEYIHQDQGNPFRRNDFSSKSTPGQPGRPMPGTRFGQLSVSSLSGPITPAEPRARSLPCRHSRPGRLPVLRSFAGVSCSGWRPQP
jgi:hypothetical protein